MDQQPGLVELNAFNDNTRRMKPYDRTALNEEENEQIDDMMTLVVEYQELTMMQGSRIRSFF